MLTMAGILLLVSPVLIAVGAALSPQRGRGFLVAALGTLAGGSAGLIWAGGLDSGPGVRTQAVFLGLLALYAAVILMPRRLRERNRRLFSTVLPLSFLMLYIAGAMLAISLEKSRVLEAPEAASQSCCTNGSPGGPAL